MKTFSWFGQNNATVEETLEFANKLIELVNADNNKKLIFEIAPKIYEKKMNWVNAMDYCESLGNGWRMPTIDELWKIRENESLSNNGEFRSAEYWSCSLPTDAPYGHRDDIAHHLRFQTNMGKNLGLKTQLLYVRPIRDL
jgi:hypothetical protein